jgi:hypothetical protein
VDECKPLIDGLRTIKVLNKFEVEWSERPVRDVAILSCAMVGPGNPNP